MVHTVYSDDIVMYSVYMIIIDYICMYVYMYFCINTNREHIQILSVQVTTLISPSMALLLPLGQFHSCSCLVLEGIRITNQLAPNLPLLRATFGG